MKIGHSFLRRRRCGVCRTKLEMDKENREQRLFSSETCICILYFNRYSQEFTFGVVCILILLNTCIHSFLILHRGSVLVLKYLNSALILVLRFYGNIHFIILRKRVHTCLKVLIILPIWFTEIQIFVILNYS